MAKKEKFLLVSLKESKAKQLAQAISNKTCRQILEFLADKEATESELAKKLSIPISTVHYNLQILSKAGLVEADEFHYSEKGREVNHYRLANKYIIIAPKSTHGIKEKLKSILPVAFGIGLTGAILKIFSGGFGIGKFAAPGVRTTMDYAVESAVPVVSEVVQEAVPLVVSKGVEIIEEEAAVVASSGAQVIFEDVVPVVANNVTTVTQTITKYVPVEPSIFTNAALWFLVGAGVAVVLYLLIDWVRNR